MHNITLTIVIMKDFTYKILAFFLAFMVLFATTSFIAESHLCLDKVYSYMFFGHARDCDMNNLNDCGVYNNTSTLSKKSCCINDLQIKKSSTILQNRIVHLKRQEITFLATNISTNLKLVEIFKQPLNTFIKYPPLLVKNKFSIFYQVFII